MPLIGQLLCGRRLEAIEHDEHSWSFVFSDGLTLTAYCPWRVINEGDVLFTGGDHGRPFGGTRPFDAIGSAEELLGAKAVRSVPAGTARSDLILDFGSEVTLQFMAHSGGFEAWVLTGPDEVTVVGRPGQ